MNSEGRILIYTTAPKAHDVMGTHTLVANAGESSTGRTYRLVSIHPEHDDAQIQAYVGNMFSVLSEEDWGFEIQFGNVIATVNEKIA